MRNPGRTASTAAALMIGLTLVSFVAVFGKALLASDENALRKQLGTSHVITSQSGWDTVPIGAGEAVAAAPGVVVSSSIRGDRAQLLGDGGEVDVSGVDPATIGKAYNFEWVEGSPAALATLARGDAVVREGEGHVGDTLRFLTPAGKQVEAVVRGVYRKHSDLDQLLGQVVLSQAAFDGSFPRPADLLTLVEADSTAALERALAAYPDAKLQTGDEFIAGWTAWLSRRDEPLLRPAGAVGDRVPLRDGEHARARRLRADARARHAPRGRDDASPGAADDPAGERDHGADRRRARAPARRRARGARDAVALGVRRLVLAARRRRWPSSPSSPSSPGCSRRSRRRAAPRG